MNSAKLRLSAEEEALISNSRLILTKNRLLEEITRFLAAVQQQQQQWLTENGLALPEQLRNTGHRITRGEQYLGLPYRVLDFPRLYGEKEVFAIRTLFLWGHAFSVTLHLAGSWQQQALPYLEKAWPALQEQQFYVCTGTDPWQQHFTADYYTAVTTAGEQARKQATRPFIKLTALHPFSNGALLDEKLLNDFKELLKATGITG